MKKSKWIVLLSMVFMFSVLFLAACDDNGSDEPDDTNGYEDNGYDDENGYDDDDENGDEDEPDEDENGDTGDDGGSEIADGDVVPMRIREMINTEMPSSDDVIDGGVLRFARVDGSAFAGVLHPIWANAAMCSNIHDFFLGVILTVDENFLTEVGEDGRGAATMDISEDGLTATFTIREGVYWHDGEPLTAQDWELGFEALMHPDSTSLRFGQQNEQFIVGALDFHEGEADYIEGVTVIDDRTLEVEFMQIVALRETVFPFPLPYHRFADIPMDEMEDHEYVRTDVAIGFGPFIIDTIVPGESVTFTRNDDYWQGAPILDGVEYRIVSPDVIGEELRAGNVDVAHTFTESAFPYYEDLSNVTFLKDTSFVYTYIGFRLGYWDEDAGESVLNPDATMANEDLRRAMWMAIDNDLVTTAWRGGLRWEASALVPPAFSLFHNPEARRPAYDIDAANALLDEAGFELGDDGYRTNPDGSPLEITAYGVYRDASYEAVYFYYMSQWEELGLNITLEPLVDLTTFADMFAIDGTENDDVDVFVGAAWFTGTNPDPYGLYGRTAAFNRSRYVSDRNDELLARIGSERAIHDLDYRTEAFFEWQEYMIENASLFPTEFRFEFVPINNRVVNYEIHATHNPTDGWHLVGLTQDEPYVD